MTNENNPVSIKIPKDLVDRLKAKRQPHQAIAGVVEMLLDADDKRQIKRDTKGQFARKE